MKRHARLLALALAGCVQVPPSTPLPEPPPPPPPAPAPPIHIPAPPQTPPPAVVETDEAHQVADLLEYYQRVTQMNGDDQRREFNTTIQSFNRERSSYNRTRLALLHLLPGSGFQDDTRAAQLLEPLAAGGGGALQKLASLLYVQVGERVKAQKRADQMRDQLEALRAIERSLIERGQQPQPRKP